MTRTGTAPDLLRRPGQPPPRRRDRLVVAGDAGPHLQRAGELLRHLLGGRIVELGAGGLDQLRLTAGVAGRALGMVDDEPALAVGRSEDPRAALRQAEQ